MADLRPQFNEEVVAANHPTKADVTNRAWDIEHAEDGTHNTSKDVDSFGGLASAIATWNADGSDVTLHVGTSQTSLSANLTVNSNISLICLMQGLIPIDVGKILTINGYFAGVGQCFSGAGTVEGEMIVNSIIPEWWGALGDGVTDDYAAIDKAFTHWLQRTIRGRFLFSSGKSYISNSALSLALDTNYETAWAISGYGSRLIS